MTKRNFQHRAETFGFDGPTPWAAQTLRLLFSVPRAFAPIVDSWELLYPGTRNNLQRLTADGWLNYQSALVMDTRTGLTSPQRGRPAQRYRTTAKAKRLIKNLTEDIGALEQIFPRLSPANVKSLARLFVAFDLKDAAVGIGMSCSHATSIAQMPKRTGRWWVSHLTTLGYLKVLEPLADVREVVPEHWCVTRRLCRQLLDVIDAFPETAQVTLIDEFRLKRTRFNAEITPSRVGIVGATDYDHDVQAQRVIALLMRSPVIDLDGIFTMEPRIMLGINNTTPKGRPWLFDKTASGRLAYQPDAEVRERIEGSVVRSVIEYERFQSRSDAWSHIERFLGYMHISSLPFEGGTLRFVVESQARVASYVKLIEAFADHSMEHPEMMPRNKIVLAVTSISQLKNATDPLADQHWSHIELTRPESADASSPVLHAPVTSPYWSYFLNK